MLPGCMVREVTGLDPTFVSIGYIVALVMVDSGVINKPPVTLVTYSRIKC